MKKLRVLVLMHETLVPPATLEGVSDKRLKEFKSEFDVTNTLREMGHVVEPLGVGSDLGVLRETIQRFDPHIAWNLVEEFHGVALYDQHVVSYLELMKRHYTGCNPRGLMLAHDKALSKQVLGAHRIRVPQFAVFPLGRTIRRPRKLAFPLFVKSLTDEGSAGIARASLVRDDAQLQDRVRFVHEKQGTDAIAEQYIEGREMYVGVLGNTTLKTLPIWELKFTKMPDDVPLIATSRVKWDWEYQKQRGIVWGQAKDLDPSLARKIDRVCRRTYRHLHLSGYARIDLRITDADEVYVLEANPNPDISYGAEFAESAEAAGLSYEALLQRVVNLGLKYEAAWQSSY